MKSNKGRIITIEVTPENIASSAKTGAGLHFMVCQSLKDSGYIGSSVTSTGIEVSTRSGQRWLGNFDPRFAAKMTAATSLKARPARLKSFSVQVRIFRPENFVPATTSSTN